MTVQDLIAQTNVQLYNQLRHQDYSLDDISSVHQAYELAKTLYSGRHIANGKPFICHFVGVASIVAHLGLSSDWVVVGLLHNIYGNGDFGDGLSWGVTAHRRSIVTKVVGESANDLILRFNKHFRIVKDNNHQREEPELNTYGPTDRALVLLDLADLLEKITDLSELYSKDHYWVTDIVFQSGDDLVKIAQCLGSQKLADWLSSAFEQVVQAKPEFPSALQTLNKNNNKHDDLIMPLSCHYSRRLKLFQFFQKTSRHTRKIVRSRLITR